MVVPVYKTRGKEGVEEERGRGELKCLPGVATCCVTLIAESPIKGDRHERMQKKKLHSAITTELHTHDL